MMSLQNCKSRIPEKRALVIANFAEEFRDFYTRDTDVARRARLLRDERVITERALLWTQAEEVLVVLPVPVARAQLTWLEERLDRKITALWPREASDFLCQDIMRETDLLSRVVEWCQNGTPPLLIPYAATDPLADLLDILLARYDSLDLSGIPTASFWGQRRGLDTKSGFKVLCQQLMAKGALIRLPRSWICNSWADAVDPAYDLLSDCGVVIKADDGSAGLGMVILERGSRSREDIYAVLSQNPYVHDTVVIVEELVLANDNAVCSPSIEVEVTPAPLKPPRITYSCEQVITGNGEFLGVRIDAEVFNVGWREEAELAALTIGNELQRLGYRGIFDIDFAISADGHPVVLEANLRRTGGTHAHELAERMIGSQYWEHHCVLSRDSVPIKPVAGWRELKRTMGEILIPSIPPIRGIVPTMVGTASDGYIGIVAIGQHYSDALQLCDVLTNPARG